MNYINEQDSTGLGFLFGIATAGANFRNIGVTISKQKGKSSA